VTTLRWRIDAFEEGMAAIEDEHGRLLHVPREFLPPDSREDHVLAVVIETSPDGTERRLRIAYDREETERRLRRSIEQIRNLPPQNDPGGDIRL
jgi:hypothetical protein